MTSPAAVVAGLIDQSRLATFRSKGLWLLSIGNEPEAPNAVVTTYDLGGLIDTDEMDVDMAEVQVRVRSSDYREGWDKIREIRDHLNKLPPTQFNGQQVGGISTQAGISMLLRDDNDRYVFVCTFSTLIQQG